MLSDINRVNHAITYNFYACHQVPGADSLVADQCLMQRQNKDMDLDSITKSKNKTLSPQPREPQQIDIGRLGMWSRFPDRHMQHSQRHCDPLQPTYCIHDQELIPVAPRKVNVW